MLLPIFGMSSRACFPLGNSYMSAGILSILLSFYTMHFCIVQYEHTKRHEKVRK